jgi:hypothetical protein
MPTRKVKHLTIEWVFIGLNESYRRDELWAKVRRDEMREKQRLDFIIERDGLVEAVAFAKRTMVVYRKSVLISRKRGFDKPHHASFIEFRRNFIQSYCDFKRFISDNA